VPLIIKSGIAALTQRKQYACRAACRKPYTAMFPSSFRSVSRERERLGTHHAADPCKVAKKPGRI